MRKSELISCVAKKMQVSFAEAREVLDYMADVIQKELEAGKEVSLFSLGKLKIKKTAPRKGRNPKTGEEVLIPSRKKVFFLCSKDLKEKIKNS